jgi:hypothetical protein
VSHRPIQPIDTTSITPGGTPRKEPIFEYVDPGTLLVDEDYQRDISQRSLKLIHRIVANWDWSKFKAPVAVLTDAGMELIDGQCTSIAACSHPDIGKIPVMLVEVSEQAQRAAAFIGHNKDRISVTATQLHTAAIIAGDAGAAAVQRVCSEAGVKILRTTVGVGRYKPAETVSISTISTLIKSRGEITAVRVMSCLARAQLSPIGTIHIKAVDYLLNTDEYSKQIKIETLVETIQFMGAAKAEQDAAVFRAAHPTTPLWQALGIIWFRSRRAAKRAAANATLPEGRGGDGAADHANVDDAASGKIAAVSTVKHQNPPRSSARGES